MDSSTVPTLPSENSAFTRPGRRTRRNIPASSSVCRKLDFGESAAAAGESDVARKLCESIRSNQNAFRARWKCSCDVISSCCDKHGSVQAKSQKIIPVCDWVPISKSGEEVPSLLKRFELARISVDSKQRPESPVPFLPHHCSTALSDETAENCEPAPTENSQVCLTPPCSPDQKMVVDSSSPRNKKKLRQTKLTETYQLKKSRRSLKNQPSTSAIKTRSSQDTRMTLRKRLRSNNDLIKDLKS